MSLPYYNLFFSYGVFQCFQVLLQLNHYIIEPHLSTVLQYCWSNDQQTDKENMSSCDVFMSSLVKTYTKLRQVSVSITFYGSQGLMWCQRMGFWNHSKWQFMGKLYRFEKMAKAKTVAWHDDKYLKEILTCYMYVIFERQVRLIFRQRRAIFVQ